MAESQINENDILDAILSLPQSNHFKKHHIQRFIDARKDDPRALWHVSRLAGVGGSEIGILVSALRDEADSFGRTPETLLREKLLVFPPKKTTMAMRKGIVSETCIRQIFSEDYKTVRDDETMALMESSAVKTPYPWMRYSPDDVVFIGDKRYLIDYKRPDVASLHHDVLLGYRSQLHQGKMILDYNGVHIDGMLLVQFPEKGDDLIVSEVVPDDALFDDIVTSGNTFWKEVMDGRVIAYDPNKELPRELTSEDQADLVTLSGDFTRTKVMAKALADDVVAIQSKMIGIIESRAVPPGKIALTGMNVGVTAKFDYDVLAQMIGDEALEQARQPVYAAPAMAAYLQSKNIDMSQFESGEFVWNEPKLREMMTEREMHEAQFVGQKLRMTVSCTTEYKEDARMAVTGVRDIFRVVEKDQPSQKTAVPKFKN